MSSNKGLIMREIKSGYVTNIPDFQDQVLKDEWLVKNGRVTTSEWYIFGSISKQAHQFLMDHEVVIMER